MKSGKVITRFPPSPTGFLQMGNVRTAIYNYLFARQNGGQFIFRIEDTDKERSTKAYEVELVENLHWLGLKWDNTVFTRQSERSEIYTKYLEKLLKEGKAYVSKEEVKEVGQRAEVIRFKNPNKKVIFEDMIRGEISFDTTELGDFVIAKSLTEPIYHLAVVIDDFESGITHIIRGEDHISNTPRQILIQEAIGAPRPVYAHLPLILDADRAKLSKRKHGEKISLRHFIAEGFLPSAIVNYMAMLGWNPGTDQEIFTLEELVKAFDISKVQKSGAIFSEEKMRWFNKEHLNRLPKDELYTRIKEIIGEDISGEFLEKLTPVLTERIQTFADLKVMKEQGEFDYLFKEPEYSKEALLFKGKGNLTDAKKHLEKVIALLKEIPVKTFDKEIV